MPCIISGPKTTALEQFKDKVKQAPKEVREIALGGATDSEKELALANLAKKDHSMFPYYAGFLEVTFNTVQALEKLSNFKGPNVNSENDQIKLVRVLANSEAPADINKARKIIVGFAKSNNKQVDSKVLRELHDQIELEYKERIKDLREVIESSPLPSHMQYLAECLALTKESNNVEEARKILLGLIEDNDCYSYAQILAYIHKVGGVPIAEQRKDFFEASQYPEILSPCYYENFANNL